MLESKKVAGLAAALAAAVLLAPGCKKSAPPTEAPPPVPAPAVAPAPAAEGPPAAPAAPAAPPAPPANPHGAGGPDQQAMAEEPPPDEATRAVFAYPVTIDRAQAYCKSIKELRAAGEKDEKLMARLRAPKPPGNQQAELAAWLEGIPPLKAILDKNKLKGLDLVLMPQALMQGRVAYARQREGVTVPPDRTNASSLELHRAQPARMEKLVSDCMGDLRVISGR